MPTDSTGHIQGRMLAQSSINHQASVLDAFLTALLGLGAIAGPREIGHLGDALRSRIGHDIGHSRAISAALLTLADATAQLEVTNV